MRLAAVALLVLGAACRAYDPDLGGAPFLCGTTDPRCPDGYVAVDVSVIRCECRRPGPADAGDGYACYPDPHEPNESFTDATPVGIQPPLPKVFDNISICPGTDVDVYEVLIAKVGSRLDVDVLFDAAREAPRLDLTDMTGHNLGATVLNPGAGKLSASIVARYAGAHHVELRAGPAGQTVNYTLRIQVTEP
ncbi:MAG TPA: hypothetical protein VKE22_06535 [Haliangiales bacterium]|nr:hypothetical protein [Haliangiales bacterium]